MILLIRPIKNGRITQAWKSDFEKVRRKSHQALSEQDTATVLLVVFERLYTLRNQVFHGGSTHDGNVNRAQLKDATQILSDILPVFLQIMIQKPTESLWGKPYYLVVKD